MTVVPRPTNRLLRCKFAAVALIALVSPAVALGQDQPGQDVPAVAPAHLAVVDGYGVIDRDRETVDAVAGEVLVPGDRLRTDSARAELWFPDGSILDVDARSVVDFQSPTLMRLSTGRVMLGVSRDAAPSSSGALYQIDTPLGSVIANGAGEFKVTVTGAPGDESIEAQVLRGSAQLLSERGALVVRGGERTVARVNSEPTRPQMFNSARFDPFDQWIAAQRDGERGRATSSQYLPSNLRQYGGTFDRNGSWDYQPSYGYVWYPSVAAGWRPYYNGYWRPLPAYGWTWIGVDAWGWPTHHYGRWGYGRARWFWIPERHFAPAWVSWASAANYVSWCPLGFNNRPVFGFSIAAGNTWAGWTVLPRTHFGGHVSYVNRYAVEGRRLPYNTAFAVHSQQPNVPGFRGRVDGFNRGEFRATRSAPGGVAVPRSPQSRPYEGSASRGASRPASPSYPSSTEMRTRANRRNPQAVAPGNAPPIDSGAPPNYVGGRLNNASGSPNYVGGRPSREEDRNGTSRAVPRYRMPSQTPSSREISPRGGRPTPTSPTPERSRIPFSQPAPQPSSSPASQPSPGWVMRRAPQNEANWGRPSAAPARPSVASGERSPNPGESRASPPPRESAPPRSGGERAVLRGESPRGSGGGDHGSGNSGGGGGHGPRHP